MKLRTVEITEYKSIRQSTPVEIGDITALVGKNESGKTALLEALYRLNPVIAKHAPFDVTEDYPRSDVEDYRQDVEMGKRPPAIVTTAVFDLEETDLVALHGVFGNEVLSSAKVTLSKGYENQLRYELPVDEAGTVRGLLAGAGLPSDIASQAAASADLQSLLAFLSENASQTVKRQATATARAATLDDGPEKAAAIDEASKLVESAAAKQLRTLVTAINKSGVATYIWEQYLKALLPTFLYFDEYYQMRGVVNIEQLLERQRTGSLENSDYPMLGLIAMARLKPNELLSPDRTMNLVNSLQGASNHLSKQILPYWSQNQHIRLNFDVSSPLN